MRFAKFLQLLAVVAVICLFSVLTARAQCPGGVCYQQPQPIYVAPQPVFRAPLREAVYKFLTPQGHVVYGYYRGPVAPVSREQAIANAAYWQERARQLGGQ
jgi:hypothetical protein